MSKQTQTIRTAATLAEWTPVATNTFDGGGNFALTNGIDPNAPQQFYLLAQ